MKSIRILVVCLFAVVSFAASFPVFAGDKKALVGGRLIDGLLGAPVANSNRASFFW